MSKEKNKEYFPHDQDASEDPKMMLVITQLGLEGYGIYWILIEYLRKQPGYVAPLIILDSLARKYGCSREKFEVVLTKYNDLFDTPLFVINHSTFHSPSLQDRMSKLDGKRQMMKQNALKRWEKDANVMQLHSESSAIAMQSRVEESREEKSIVEKSKIEERKDKFSLAVKDFSNIYPEAMLNSFILYWTEKNKSGTKMKYELEKTFEIPLRLSTWARREKDFDKGRSSERPIFY
jgi:hypothetical protein